MFPQKRRSHVLSSVARSVLCRVKMGQFLLVADELPGQVIGEKEKLFEPGGRCTSHFLAPLMVAAP